MLIVLGAWLPVDAPSTTTLKGADAIKNEKDGLHVKDDQRTVTVSPVELQHTSDLPKLEDDLKCLEKPDPMIQFITEKRDEYIVSDTEELHLQNCLKDVKEGNACIPLKKADSVVAVPESVPKEVKRRAHEKRRPRIKENKDYYFIPKLRQKIENSIANCDHGVLIPFPSPFVVLVFVVCLQCRLEDQPIPGWPSGAGGYLQAPPITSRSMLFVLGAWLPVDASSTTTLKGADAIVGRRRHGRNDGLRKTESKDAIEDDNTSRVNEELN
ncbi:hypothetical protein TNIN_138611 [Trichonephila inaurata madagascariensis]|uniref:Uncharacterized protein n=1 Tax=Trichonephila inaurata madagascariensis TaxID=2747483 RepID=A0A8X6X2U1_9ARAC|nr:hypothetical protein TNIN_321761 [Trichonephila inaurata madagascariensis]GFY74205.1 hypothetical protein TNIN_138611 [Trichonephila inaurata madagascariensis]